jgi:CHASE2 domain-containing sensor protein
MVMVDFVFGSSGPSADGANELIAALQSLPTVIGSYTDGDKSLQPLPKFQEAAKYTIKLNVLTLNKMVMLISSDRRKDAPIDERIPLIVPIEEFRREAVSIPGPLDHINFYGPPGTIENISYETLFTGDENVLAEKVKNRFVFIGLGSNYDHGVRNQHDTFITPVSTDIEPMFGVEIHATIAANLLDGSYLRRLDRRLELLIMPIFALLVTYAGYLRGALFILSANAAWGIFTYIAFAYFNLLIPCLPIFYLVLPLQLILLGVRNRFLAQT